MTEKDTIANTLSVTGMTLSIMNFETVLTILVLVSALVLNVIRIIEIKKGKKGEGE